MEILKSITDYPPFNTIGDLELREAIEDQFEPAVIPPYTLIMEKNKKIHRIGYIRSGSIDLFSDTGNGYTLHRGTLGKGKYFGIESLFERETALFDEMTTEPVECFTIKKENLIFLLSRHTGLKTFFESVLIETVRTFFTEPAPDTGKQPREKAEDRRLKKSIEYIDSHYMEGICLDDIARITGLSRFHFSRLFKAATGHTFKDYLNLKRLESAKRLLQFQEINISQACFAVGFNDASYFARLFKKYEGMSPSLYRKANKKAEL